MKFRLPLLFDLLIIIFFVIFLYEARDWRLQARLYPWAIGIPMLALALVHIFWELKGGKKPSIQPSNQPSNAPVDFSFTKGIDPLLARRRAINIFSWIFAFFLGIWLFGFAIAIPAFVFFYLKVQSGEGWGLSLALTGGAWFMFWGLFDWLLRLPFPEGQLLIWLGLT